MNEQNLISWKAEYSLSQKNKLNEKGDHCHKELNLPLSVDYKQRAQAGDVTSDDSTYKVSIRG